MYLVFMGLRVDLKNSNFQLLYMYLLDNISCCNEIFRISCVNIVIHVV